MATGPFCGKDGRVRVKVSGIDQPVAGISEWSRNERSALAREVDFESPTNNAGLPISRVCPGPVEITYEVQGYFFSDPATGVTYTTGIFGAGVTLTADFLFRKTGNVGIKQIVGVVENVRLGQRVEGMSTFSATIVQVSADPDPLVS